MSTHEWQAAGRYFSYREQHRIFYRQEGTGEPLLLLHGFPTASWDWHLLWESLAERYTLLAPDFIGFGFSDKPRRYDYRLTDQADLVEALLADQGWGRAHLLVHDYGVSVAQELLARQAAGMAKVDILSVAFLNGGLFPEAHRPRPIQRALLGPLGFLLTPFLNKRKLRKNFNEIFGPDTQPSDAEIDGFYRLIDARKGQYIFHRLIRYMEDRYEHGERWKQALIETTVPLCLLNGGADPVSGKHLANFFADLVPAAKVVIWEDIGHYPQVEVPEQVLAAYFEFQRGLT
ncbi:MAG: alpha/beta hydrolase [Lewinella sp.]|nr:alpha/beta hydrolase [Lewinella sp.]